MHTKFNKKTTATLQLQNPLMGLTTVGEYYQKSKVNGLSSNTIRNISNQVLNLLEKWQVLLDIHRWTITCEPIDEMQVMDDLKGDKPGHEFVGIAIDFINRKGIIHHTRSLQEDDIIHELLHVRFPDWSEQKVNYWTGLLINRPDIDILKQNNV